MGRVFVAGSINMDVVATADRHPKVGETVIGRQVLYFPGGKGANQAVAAARLGLATTLIGRLGIDGFGAELRNFLADGGLDLGYVQQTAEAHTGTAIITVAGADNTIVVIPGANAHLSADDVTVVPLVKGDIAVSQLEIPLATIEAFFRRARLANATTLLNAAPAMKLPHEFLELVDILVLNETELGLLGDAELSDADPAQIAEAARRVRVSSDQVVCITLGRRGVLALADGEELIVPGRLVQAVDTTGAGDCFVGALAAQLADGARLRDALVYANAAASICVQRMGAGPSMPVAAEVSALVQMR